MLGQTQFANLSNEGEDDISDLREYGLLERLKLATSYHYHVAAFRVTIKGTELLRHAPKEYRDAVDGFVTCAACGGSQRVETQPDMPYLVCSKCPRKVPIPIFEIEEMNYKVKPRAIEIWLS